MKNGEKIVFLTFMFLLGSKLGKANSKKKLMQKNSDPSIAQYLNRLVEFYPNYQLDYMEDEFLTLVDFGLSPSDAFNAVVKW